MGLFDKVIEIVLGAVHGRPGVGVLDEGGLALGLDHVGAEDGVEALLREQFLQVGDGLELTRAEVGVLGEACRGEGLDGSGLVSRPIPLETERSFEERNLPEGLAFSQNPSPIASYDS